MIYLEDGFPQTLLNRPEGLSFQGVTVKCSETRQFQGLEVTFYMQKYRLKISLYLALEKMVSSKQTFGTDKGWRNAACVTRFHTEIDLVSLCQAFKGLLH